MCIEVSHWNRLKIGIRRGPCDRVMQGVPYVEVSGHFGQMCVPVNCHSCSMSKVALIGVLHCQGNECLPARLSHNLHAILSSSVSCPDSCICCTETNEGFCRVCVCNILTCSCFELQKPYGQRIVFLAVICLSAHVIGCILEMRSCLKLELSS